LINLFETEQDLVWYEVLNKLNEKLSENEALEISKNQINGMLLVARQADVIRTLKGRTLSTAPVILELNSSRAFQKAVICIDNTYLKAILALQEPFDFSEAAIALYDNESYAPYLRRIVKI
jgi:hypothetical protein